MEFLNHYSKINKNSYKIKSYPDKVERNKKACDVIAQIGEELFAIEHTSIDSIPFQRRDDRRFMELLGPLESKLAGKLPTPGHYQLLVPMNAIPTRIDWADVHLRILRWCQKVAPNLKIGDSSTAPRHFVRELPQGVPFEVTLYRWPGQDGQFKIGRFSPEDADLEKQREKVINQALNTRGKKVSKYRNKGYKTILILESNDIALANSSIIGQVFANVIKKISYKEKPDEVYLIETETYPYYFTCLKKDNSIYPESSQQSF